MSQRHKNKNVAHKIMLSGFWSSYHVVMFLALCDIFDTIHVCLLYIQNLQMKNQPEHVTAKQ